MDKKKSDQKNKISRRKFLNYSSAGVAGVILSPVPGIFSGKGSAPAAWPAEAVSYRFHMIGQAHIDPVWLWPWSEGVAVVHSTFRSALERIKENPEFCFTASSAQFYEWVAENDPAMLVEIRKRIDEGRWNMVGGWWIEPDMNIPSGEAMVRQGLYGQLTMEKLTGRRATVAYCPDSFGHTNTLPQIIRQQGMENYIFMRPGIREKTIPADLFWWEGSDGTKVLTYRIQFSYNDGGSVKNRVQQILSKYQDQPMKSFMAYYGAGDHGGGATKENIKSIEELKAEKKAPAVFFSTTDRYFAEIRASKELNLPVVKDDLQHHAVGCYTADWAIKKGNRHSEAELVNAEKIAAIGAMAWGAAYPKEKLTEAWKKVLFMQFHDSLAGTSLPEHNEAARYGHGHAIDTARSAAVMAVQKLEWQIPSDDPEAQYLVLYNPHSWQINSNFEYDLNDMHGATNVEDGAGNQLRHQWNPGSTETSRKRILVNASVPPMGYTQVKIEKGDPLLIKNSVRADKNVLENTFLRVTFASDGSISLFDKENNREILGPKGFKAVMINDPSDTWSHDIKTFSEEIGAFENPEIKIMENGPLRSSVRVTTSYGLSKLAIDWILYSGSRHLEARVSLDWHEHLKMLKFSFPADIESPVATYETPYGFIVREANGNEDPGQRWIDVTGRKEGKTFGLTVINDAKYGYSVNGNDLRISVARSSPYAHHNPKVLDANTEHIWMDQGIQTFRMVLVPHTGKLEENMMIRAAEELMAEPVIMYQGIHAGTLPKTGSFASLESGSVIISAVKQAESNSDLIIRCVETAGQPAEATLNLGFAGKKWTGGFKPFEIKSLRYSAGSGDIRIVSLLEE
jgi:alpha-mannosidase